MSTVVVLGCGLVGSLIARDLADDRELRVIAVDASQAALDRLAKAARVEVRREDLSQREAMANAMRDADVVVGAVPGRMGLMLLETAIAAGKPVCDISFAPEDPLALEGAARDRGVTVVVDCGVSPGLSNLAIGRAASQLAEVREAVIYVGGLPFERHWPYEYRSVFSPTDVIEEYTRPARLVENGTIVTKPALSEVETIDVKGAGTLEAFNTDGLRTLLRTVPATHMREKTLRFPGHVDRMRMLRETGFFSSEPVKLGGVTVAPRELTEKLLFDAWRRRADETEFTVLRVTVRGPTRGATTERRYVYDLFDRTDPRTGDTSMARTTGFPCAIVTRELARGRYREPGVKPLEALAPRAEMYDAIVKGLAERGVNFRESVEEVQPS